MMEPPPGLPPLPGRIHRLGELAFDLWWTWNQQARDVFRRLEYPLWRATSHNPVRLLHLIAPERLAEAAQDPSFLELYDSTLEALDHARAATDTWWQVTYPDRPARPIAYFSAEFALHQSLPIYAGGLGVLAGDLCKEASDLGLPAVGVGFMYPQGYFHQKISPDGRQVEVYERLDWDDAPVRPAVMPDGQPCIIAVPLGDRSVLVRVWHVRLGRSQLYLLDTGLEENAPWDRELSARLYGGDRETRVQQEIVLGVGGVRVVRALGLDPLLWHLNEGHAAFVVLQRLHELLEQGELFDAALAEVRRTTVFTTHTPVAAGHDAFPFHLVETQLAGCWGTLGPQRDAFLALGHHDNGYGPQFNMTALALRASGSVNAVSQVHRRVSLDMWAPILASRSADREPVRAVTNGIHLASWIAPDIARLFGRYLPDWRARQDDRAVWDGVLAIPDEELWAVRQALRGYLFAFIRERARQRWTEERVSAARVVAAGTLLDPAALTIGFARRFTGYKRPDLVFHNPERLARILNSSKGPVQIIFAGKSHPADETGKHHLQQVLTRAADPVFGGRIAFVDDYDLHVAHFLVQGCDVWLNTPRKPLEASGTSGMKASVNGVPHVSVGDGWWAEGFTGSNGWLIDGDAPVDDPDAADAEALYRLLEAQIVPTFYTRDAHDIPRVWLQVMKEAIRTIAPRFSARRVVKEYVRELYGPAMRPAGAAWVSSHA